MRKSVWEKRHQLLLDLEPRQPRIDTIQNPTGVVAALADLLLSAMGVNTLLASGGDDDR